jgi:outer membrane biosynthesis protein TonB
VNSRFFQLLGPTPDARSIWGACVLVACFMHFAVAGMLSDPPPLTASIPVTEVELEPPRALEPPPPQPAPEPPPPAAAAPPPAKMRARKAPDPPAPARAGKLLTALEEPESQPRDDEPVRFVTDPNGRGYGTGIVARGGTAEHGEISTPLPTPPAAPSGLRITPADLLKRQPLLLGDGCRGYFPEHARPDQGVVSIVATVHPSGAIAKLEIESETPEGEGFASAAKACLAKRKFVPALDEHGEPTGARTRINVRFTR